MIPQWLLIIGFVLGVLLILIGGGLFLGTPPETKGKGQAAGILILGCALFAVSLGLYIDSKNSTNSNLTGSSPSMVGYYKVLKGNELTSISDTDVTVYNVYISTTDLSIPTTPTSFTSYYSYDLNGNTVINTDTIEFLVNVPVTLTSNFPSGPPSTTTMIATTTAAPFTIPNMPYDGQSIVYCMPLLAIPTTATDLQFGYQITFESSPTVTKTIPLTDMSVLTMHIFDNAACNYNLPLATVTLPSTITVPSGPFSVADIANWMTTAMDSTAARMNITNYSTDQTTALLANLIYMSPFDAQDTICNTGRWFSTMPYSSSSTSLMKTTASPSSYTTTYFVSNEETPYLSMSVKFDNYCIVGLNTSSEFKAQYVVQPTSSTTMSITTNSYPVHPVGAFPNDGDFTTQVASYCDANNEQVTAITTETLAVAATVSTSTFNPLNMDQIGYAFDNIILCQALDSGGNNPLALECLDIFGAHPSPEDYHRHMISPCLFNWILDNQIRVAGIMIDGYPIVAPFLVTDKTTGETRVVQTSDLNSNHGIVASITFSMPTLSSTSSSSSPSTTMTFPFFYVATFDWPYTAFAFYGTAATLPSPSSSGGGSGPSPQNGGSGSGSSNGSSPPPPQNGGSGSGSNNGSSLPPQNSGSGSGSNNGSSRNRKI